MDFFLSKITQQAMNYAIRLVMLSGSRGRKLMSNPSSGITITSGYALQQCSRLLKTKSGKEREQLEDLQKRLESKIRIISPAIDMIELIAARGNTSLESAVSLTKSLRWDIQNLGLRLAKAAASEELSERRSVRAKSVAENNFELDHIILDMKQLLERIEDAVPLINLAITTSGASLSTSLPLAISPSRLLQASTLLTAGDTQYSMTTTATQIGPTFTLSVYMLFAGHAHRPRIEDGLRATTWKEVIHKARLKLMRIPLDAVYDVTRSSNAPSGKSTPHDNANSVGQESFPYSIPADDRSNEFAYQILIIEDLEDDRVHTFEEEETQPGPFYDVAIAGIREAVPVHEVSKVFYADTGKILNIGADGGVNSPVLLLKRDIHAIPPRRMMKREHAATQWYEEHIPSDNEDGNSDFKKTAEAPPPHPGAEIQAERDQKLQDSWRIPSDLDPEWIALEVYTEDEDSDTESEVLEEQRLGDSKPLFRSSRQSSLEPYFTSALSQLNLTSSPASTAIEGEDENQSLHIPQTNTHLQYSPGKVSTGGVPPLKTSLSLLDMLIRLTSLQQFGQSSHLAFPDELINFFLQESATTGVAQGDSPERRRIRREARERVGFDPYAESPIKGQGNYRTNYDQTSAVNDSIESQKLDQSNQIFALAEETSPSPPSFTDYSYDKSDISTPDAPPHIRETPPLARLHDFHSAATPPNTTKSRLKYSDRQVAQASLARRSPLTRSMSAIEKDGQE